MIHINPIGERRASDSVRALYQEIKSELGTPTVPAYFQYIANYEDVFSFLWLGIKKHVKTTGFQEAVSSITTSSLKFIISIYPPNPDLLFLATHMDLKEKEQRIEDVYKLLYTQAKMLLIEIQVREAVKGMPVIPNEKILFLPESEKETLKNRTSEIVSEQSLAQVSDMEYDTFFDKIEREMNQLMKEKRYLEGRVEFEKNVLYMLLRGAFPLEITYNQFRGLLAGKPYISEFMFLLKDVFPSNAPRQLFTAALMNYILNLDSESLS